MLFYYNPRSDILTSSDHRKSFPTPALGIFKVIHSLYQEKQVQFRLWQWKSILTLFLFYPYISEAESQTVIYTPQRPTETQF